jgi:signal transduction histidine kinase/CheY-like chemotaxis protein
MAKIFCKILKGLKRPRLRGPVLILCVGLSLAFLGAFATSLAIWSNRDVVLRQWEDRLLSATHMLTAHAIQSIGAADLMLRGVEDNLKKYQFEGADDFHSVAASGRVSEMLREGANGLPQVAGFGIVSLDGTLLNLSTRPFPQHMRIAQREYLQAHIKDPALELFLSTTIINQLTHEPRFFLTRKLRAKNGDLLGILIAGIRPEFFTSFYRSSNLDVTHVTLLRSDGSILACDNNETTERQEKLIHDLAQIHLHENHHGIIYDGRQGTRRSFEEMSAIEHSHDFPIAVSISVSREQVLREWEKGSVKFVIIGGSLTACLLIATLLLARLVGQLEQARNAALSATEAKTRFITSISHELRTPMTAIIGGAHHLTQQNSNDTSRHFAQIVASSARQMMVLINDLLDFSSYETRDFRIELAPTHVSDMAHDALEMTRTLLPDSRIDLSCKINSGVPDRIIADAARIKQVLLNLLGNAVKYTQQGKVELRLSYIRGQKNLLVIQVIDTGPGISREDQARIFEPFERTQAASSLPGTGLGLTISKKLVEAMGGEIRLISELGAGTQFTVELPAPPAPADQCHILSRNDDKPVAKGSDFARSLDILVAEDVAPSRMLLTILLENMGHRVTQVENGLEALQVANEQAFDLILMDLQMPIMDGMTDTKRIREQGGMNASTCILAVSANADMDRALGFAEAGFDDRLLKPVAPERLNFFISSMATKR